MQDPSNNLAEIVAFMILPTALHRLFCFAALFLTAASAQGHFAADPDFRPPLFAKPSLPARSALLPDGKFILYNGPGTLTDQRTGAITRYFPDGTLDTSFSFSRAYNTVTAATFAAGGQLYAAAGQRDTARQATKLCASIVTARLIPALSQWSWIRAW